MKIQNSYIIDNWEKSTAIIVGYRDNYDYYEGDHEYHPQYKHVVDDKECNGEGLGSSFINYKKGDEVEIRYNLDDVCQSSLRGNINSGLFIILISSTALILIVGKNFWRKK